MRFAAIAVLGFVLIAMPALGQGTEDNAGNSRSFGNVMCRPIVPCRPGYSELPTVYATATACITQYFGYPSGDGFFDQTLGLDSNNCMAAKPNVLPKGIGAQLSPQCCLISDGGPDTNGCKVRCTLITTGGR